VDGEVHVHGAERKAAANDQVVKDRRHFRLAQVLPGDVAGQLLGDVAAPVRFAQVGGEPPGAERAVDLEDADEERVAQGRGRTPPLAATFARRFGDGGAQVGEKLLEVVLLVRLCPVVGGPDLFVRRLLRDGVRVDGRRVFNAVPLAYEPGSYRVLARLVRQLEVFAGARDGRREQHAVAGARGGLRGNRPRVAVEGDFRTGGD